LAGYYLTFVVTFVTRVSTVETVCAFPLLLTFEEGIDQPSIESADISAVTKNKARGQI
jgi:hypothetical protein